MKQIGARQEAGRIGGTGPCGRELCCATWVRNFSSVSTNAARFQGVSLNPTKLAGMCAKLKCCLNYEVDDYMEAARRLPSREVSLFTLDAEYFLVKTDILSGECTYSTDRKKMANVETISARRAREIIELNRQGEKPLSLLDDGSVKPRPNRPTCWPMATSVVLISFRKKKKKEEETQRCPATSTGETPLVVRTHRANRVGKDHREREVSVVRAGSVPWKDHRNSPVVPMRRLQRRARHSSNVRRCLLIMEK